jgi:carbon-monoxide dehydrogenase medium subunit
MRLRPFRLHRPTTLEQASELFDELGPDAVPYCGGTELLLVAKFGLTDFTDLVDVKAIDELAGIDGDPPWRGAGPSSQGAGGELRIGASTTHRQIERSPLVLERVPSMAAMERAVGNLRVRNVGTIGGNLCFGDPHSDPATYLLAAGGSVSMRRGGAAARRMSIEDFVRGPYQTALEQGELLVAVHVPAPLSGSALVHRKMSFHERPAITVTANVTVRDGAVLEARVAVGSVGVTPKRVREAEQALVGLDALAPSPDQLAAAAQAAALEADPVADSNGSIEYKRQLVRVLTGRCVSAALPLAASPTRGT